MGAKEKLVELIFSSLCRHIHKSCKLAENIADDLIANGVTVQEWISVEDRLPSECGMACLLVGVNCFGQHKVFQGFTGYLKNGIFEWHTNLADTDISVWTITHWMPLPPAPKGEPQCE